MTARAVEGLVGLAAAALIGASLVRIAGAGDFELSAPRTIVSHGAAGFYEPLLLFLGVVSRSIPPGATVSLVPPSGRPPENWMDFMVTIGQLPRQEVVLATRFLPP